MRNRERLSDALRRDTEARWDGDHYSADGYAGDRDDGGEHYSAAHDGGEGEVIV